MEDQELVVRRPLFVGLDPYSQCCLSFHPGHVEMFQKSDLVRDPGQSPDPVERHPGFEGFSQVGSILGPSHGPDQTPGRIRGYVEPAGHPFGQALTAVTGGHLPVVHFLEDL